MQAASAQRILHIAPGASAGGSLRHALIFAGRDDGVLAFPDDVSCGPIASDDPVLRAEWWGSEEDGLIGDALVAFWAAIEATSDRLVVWFSRHSALDLAFFLSWCHQLGDRPYGVVDVTGQCLPYSDRDGRPETTPPLVAVGITPVEALPILFGTERTLSSEERLAFHEAWQRLKAENTYFRIVTEIGLVSAPEDHFDAMLLESASRTWRKSARVVGECLLRNWRPYIQVHDMMLARRLRALVDAGRLEAQGDLCDLLASEVRLRG